MNLKATYQDIYDCLSFHKWKTLPEIKSELKEEGRSVRYLSGFVYARLSIWEKQGYIKSRKREKQNFQVKAYPRQTEYLKTLAGVPAEFRHNQGRLELELRHAVA